MDYQVLLDLGLIILFVKIFSMLTGRFHLPKVLGSLLAGVILGPAILNMVQSSSILETLASLGVIFIMFLAGLETSLKKFISNTKKFVVIGILGAIIPLLFGFLFSKLYTFDIRLNLFLGAVITATSVGITIEALMEMKKINTSVGSAIIGAGIVDDIIGIVFLTLITNNGNFSFQMLGTFIIKIIIFFILAIGIGILMFRFMEWLESKRPRTEELPIFSLAFALLLAFFAEKFELSGIIGAYIAGLVVGNTKQGTFIKNKIDILISMFFAPIFFASIGLKLQTLSFDTQVWNFIILFTAIAILSKLVGNGIGAKLCGYKKRESIQIGIGMATRGEVSFIMADEALKLGMISFEVFSIVVITILLITMISPILLYLSFKTKPVISTSTKTIQEN